MVCLLNRKLKSKVHWKKEFWIPASVSIKFQLQVHKQEKHFELTSDKSANIHVLQYNGKKTKVKYSLTFDVIG